MCLLMCFTGVAIAQEVNPSFSNPCRETDWWPPTEDPTLCEQLGASVSPGNPDYLEINGGLSSALKSPANPFGWSYKKILLKGPLFIDDFTIFHNCDVRITGGYRITVLPGGTIYCANSNFFACDKLWGGFFLSPPNTLQQGGVGLWGGCGIEDATEALRITSQNLFALSQNTFNRNVIGLRCASPGNSGIPITVNPAYFSGNTFTVSKTPLLGGSMPVSGLACSRTTGSFQGNNTFSRLPICVSSSAGSNILVGGAQFKDYLDYGVLASGGGLCDIGRAKGGYPCRFSSRTGPDGGYPIAAVAGISLRDLFVAEAVFEGPHVYDILDQGTNGFLSIDYNTFTAGADVIDCIHSEIGSGVATSIYENTLNLNATTNGIYVTPWAGGIAEVMAIASNTLNTRNVGHGIYVELNASPVNITDNTIVPLDSLSETAIELFNLKTPFLHTVTGNVVDNQNVYDRGFDKAIVITESPSSVCYNTVADARKGFEFNGNNFGSNIESNFIIGPHVFGLEITDGPTAAVGTQNRKGNYWVYESSSKFDAIASSASVGLSQFFIHDPAVEYFPKRIFQSPFQPIPWFSLTPGDLNLDCIPGSPSGVAGPLDEMIALGQFDTLAGVTAEWSWQARRSLYELLLEGLDPGQYGTALAQFRTNYSNASEGLLAAIAHDLHGVLRLPLPLQDSTRAWHEKRQSLKEAIALQEANMLPPDYSTYTSQYWFAAQYKGNLLDTFAMLMQKDRIVMENFRIQQQPILEQLRLRNAAVAVSIGIAQDEKALNDITIRFLQGNALTSADTLLLKAIASDTNQIARYNAARANALLPYCEKIEPVAERQRAQPEVSPINFLRVSPNPAKDHLLVQFGQEVSGTVALFDLAGRVVQQQVVEKSDQLLLPVTPLPQGIYWLRINRTDRRDPICKKVVIMH